MGLAGLRGQARLVLADGDQHRFDAAPRARAAEREILSDERFDAVLVEQAMEELDAIGGKQFGSSERIEQRADAVPAVLVAFVLAFAASSRRVGNCSDWRK